MRLESGVRIVESPLVVGGLLLFHAVESAVGAEVSAQRTCGSGERSLIFRLLITNGDGADSAGRSTAFLSCSGSPYPLQATALDENVAANFSPLHEPGLLEIRNRLMALAPPDCRYGSFAIRWVSEAPLEGLFPLAEVPICILQRDWRER